MSFSDGAYAIGLVKAARCHTVLKNPRKVQELLILDTQELLNL